MSRPVVLRSRSPRRGELHAHLGDDALRSEQHHPRVEPQDPPPGRRECGFPLQVAAGALLCPVVGTVAQFQWGRGESGWRLGGAGTPEMHDRLGQTYYEVVVAMDGGDKRTVQRKDVSRLYVGQRVALRAGELEPMQP